MHKLATTLATAATTIALSATGGALLGLAASSPTTTATTAAAAAPDHPDPVHGRDIPAWVTRPCKTEDSVNCRWNARTQGNGHGRTSIRRAVPGRAHLVCVF